MGGREGRVGLRCEMGPIRAADLQGDAGRLFGEGGLSGCLGSATIEVLMRKEVACPPPIGVGESSKKRVMKKSEEVGK